MSYQSAWDVPRRSRGIDDGPHFFSGNWVAILHGLREREREEEKKSASPKMIGTTSIEAVGADV